MDGRSIFGTFGAVIGHWLLVIGYWGRAVAKHKSQVDSIGANLKSQVSSLKYRKKHGKAVHTNIIHYSLFTHDPIPRSVS